MPTTPVRPTRRHVVRGAAWTAPVVLGVAAAPAFAASACTGLACPNVAFGAPSGTANTNGMNGGGRPAAGNGWTVTTGSTGTGWSNANPVGFVANGTAANLAATAEPTTAGRVVTATQTGQDPLRAQCRYTLAFTINRYIDATAGALVLDAVFGDGSVVRMYTTAGKTGQNVTEVQTPIQIPAGTSGALSFRFTFAQSGASNDITLIAPSLTCAVA